MTRADRKQQIRSIAAKTGKRPRGAANILNREEHARKAVEAPADFGHIYILEQVYEGAHSLFERRRETPHFTTAVQSFRADGSDRVGPNGEVAMVPLVDIAFVQERSARWRFEGALAFIVGELYDGNEPVAAELLDTAEGRKRLGQIIVGHIRAGQPWFAARLTELRVERGYQSENLVVMVSLSLAPTPIDALIEELRPFHISSIRVGRMSTAVARFSDHLRDLSNNPKYFADTAFVEKTIDHAQLLALVERGATEEGEVQRIRVFKPEQQTTFSVPCADCDRWIWCGHDEHNGECECGQKYEVTFDGEVDWNLEQGWRCMNCGEPHELAEVGSGRSPWHAINERQVACDVCFHMRHIGAWWVRKRASERAKA